MTVSTSVIKAWAAGGANGSGSYLVIKLGKMQAPGVSLAKAKKQKEGKKKYTAFHSSLLQVEVCKHATFQLVALFCGCLSNSQYHLFFIQGMRTLEKDSVLKIFSTTSKLLLHLQAYCHFTSLFF